MLTRGFAGTVPGKNVFEYVGKYHCGSLRLSCDARLFGNYVDLHGDKTVVKLENRSGVKHTGAPPQPTASEFKAVLDDLQRRAKACPLGIPLHFSHDQEGGTSADFAFGGVNIFPKPMDLRATDDPKLAYQVALAVAKQSRAVGFHWPHSPVLDVNTDPRNPEIYTRAYSDDAQTVTDYAVESCRGFAEGGRIATGKHFPGRGDSDVDAHFKVPVIDVDRETMLNREFLPYRALISKGLLPSIMLAHSFFPAFDTEHCLRNSGDVVYLETNCTYDDADKRRIEEALAHVDIFVATNYYIRGKLCNKAYLEELITKCGKPVVVVTNTPYVALSIPANAECVVVTLATSPASIEAVAGFCTAMYSRRVFGRFLRSRARCRHVRHDRLAGTS